MPLRESVIGTPVVCNALSISVTVALGFADLSTAHAPATCGVAIDVPLAKTYWLPGYEEYTEPPGASRLNKLLLLEKHEIDLSLFVEPTLTTLDTHAGHEIWLALPALPDATTVAIPALRRLPATVLNAGLRPGS